MGVIQFPIAYAARPSEDVRLYRREISESCVCLIDEARQRKAEKILRVREELSCIVSALVARQMDSLFGIATEESEERRKEMEAEKLRLEQILYSLQSPK